MRPEKNKKTYKYVGLLIAAVLIIGLIYKLVLWLFVFD